MTLRSKGLNTTKESQIYSVAQLVDFKKSVDFMPERFNKFKKEIKVKEKKIKFLNDEISLLNPFKTEAVII